MPPISASMPKRMRNSGNPACPAWRTGWRRDAAEGLFRLHGMADDDGHLIDVLDARSGLVCLVGAGGKKTTVYRLAAAHPGRVAVTATSKLPPFPPAIAPWGLSRPSATIAEAVTARARESRGVAYCGPLGRSNRMIGVAPETIVALHHQCGFDVTYVKADGARARLAKAPGEHEPRLVACPTTVIPVVSIKAVGRTVDLSTVHRPARFAAVTGAHLGEPIETRHLARLLASDEGALQGTDSATVVPIINMADDVRLARLAREVAEDALTRTRRLSKIVITCMIAASPVIDVVTGGGGQA